MKTLLSIIAILFGSTLSCGQSVPKTYKSFNEPSYQVGDIILAPVLWFNVNGCEVLDEYLDSLQVIANFVAAHPGYIVEIGAHTDNRAAPETCMEVSKCRAKFIVGYLTKKLKSPKKSYDAKGYGFNEPVVDEEMIRLQSTHRNYFDEKNRRVEIKILFVK